MTPEILNSQEMKSDFNSKMLNFQYEFYQLLKIFTKLEMNTICSAWIALFTFRTTKPSCLLFFSYTGPAVGNFRENMCCVDRMDREIFG